MDTFGTYDDYKEHRQVSPSPMTCAHIHDKIKSVMFTVSGNPMYCISGKLVSVKRFKRSRQLDITVANSLSYLSCTVDKSEDYIMVWDTSSTLPNVIEEYDINSVTIGSRLYAISERKIVECIVQDSHKNYDVSCMTVSSTTSIREGTMLFNVFGDAVGFAIPRNVHKCLVLPIKYVIDYIKSGNLPTSLGLRYHSQYHITDVGSSTSVKKFTFIKKCIQQPSINNTIISRMYDIDGNPIQIQDIPTLPMSMIVVVETVNNKGITITTELKTVKFSPYIEDNDDFRS